jgi:subtilisin family serine protease
MTIRRCSFLVILVSLTVAAQVAPKKTVSRAADLPSFTYTVSGTAGDLLTKEETFRPFAVQLRKDVESVLAEYDIKDRGARRDLLNVLLALDLLEGKDPEARRRLDEIAAIEEKPDQKYTSGVVWRAVLDARRVSHDRKSVEYQGAFQESLRRALDAMPFVVVENQIEGMKTGAEIQTAARFIGQMSAVIDPVLKKSGTLSSGLANQIATRRLALVERLPLRDSIVETFAGYLAAHKIEKPDIWATRDVTLETGKGYASVPVAAWDSGVDLSIYRGQLEMENGKPAVLAYDVQGRPTTDALRPLPAAYREHLSQNMSRFKGLMEIQAHLDTPEASAVKKELAQLKAEQVRSYSKEVNATLGYSHGTHVAGIMLAGNPYARLVTARFTRDYLDRTNPDPCPSRELSRRNGQMFRNTVAFFQRNKVRVVNMSWGQSVGRFEHALELCGKGANTEARKQMARELFDMEAKALEASFSSAPEILFVAAGGNFNNDSSFNELVPASFRLPNLLAVGAVDQAGDEASFTSYGPTIVAHAKGVAVESYVPGGQKMKLSGTSMASPNAANLAAKILAVNPKLTPPQVIEIIRGTADTTPDGRRFLINPKRAVERAREQK